MSIPPLRAFSSNFAWAICELLSFLGTALVALSESKLRAAAADAQRQGCQQDETSLRHPRGPTVKKNAVKMTADKRPFTMVASIFGFDLRSSRPPAAFDLVVGDDRRRANVARQNNPIALNVLPSLPIDRRPGNR